MPFNHSQPVRWYRQQFAGLQPVSEASAIGIYHAVFVGPWWLRVGARWSLPLSGLRGWFGKRIQGGGQAVNLVRRSGSVRDYCPMQVSAGPSRIDGRTSLLFSYGPEAPGLLRFFQDELRQWDGDHILAFATVNLPLLRLIPLPFMLRKIPDAGPQMPIHATLASTLTRGK